MSVPQEQEQNFPKTNEGWAKRWTMELKAAKERLRKFHEQGDKVDKLFRDEREDADENEESRWNVYTSNVQTLGAMLYGNTPKVSVSRRFQDAQDDVARVAGELLERLLNTDIERRSDSYATALRNALKDRLIPGFGNVRVRYVAEFEKVAEVPAKLSEDGAELAPAVPESERVSYEDVATDYVHWRDQLWGYGRVFDEVPWWAFRVQMTREKLIERFGEKLGKMVPLATKKREDGKGEEEDPWSRADVWEVWSKEHGRVFWVVEGFAQVLDEKEDPLELEGFWPFPEPMFANLTTSKLVPRPDYAIAQDLYEEVNTLSTRIKLLVSAVRAAGVYDKANDGVKRLLEGNEGNKLYPVDNWAMFAEKGGLKGAIDWLPLEQIVAAISVLREQRSEVMDALFQITGWSDIMRGQATSPGVTATEQGIKAKFGSVRVQALQDDFARFASEVQKLKAEIIAKRFSPQTILERSNIRYTRDAQLAPHAVELIKSQFSCYRVEVKPEAVSLTDFAALKAERTEVIGAMATYFQAAAPLAQQMPGSLPYLLQILQWMVSGLRGASQIEGVLDEAIQAAQQQQAAAAANPQPQAPDPKIIAQQMKMQGDLAKTQADLQADLVRINAETQAHEAQEAAQAKWNVREAAQKQLVTNTLKPATPPTNGRPR